MKDPNTRKFFENIVNRIRPFNIELISDFANANNIPIMIKTYDEEFQLGYTDNPYQFDLAYFEKDKEKIDMFLYEFKPIQILVNHYIQPNQIECTQQKLIESYLDHDDIDYDDKVVCIHFNVCVNSKEPLCSDSKCKLNRR